MFLLLRFFLFLFFFCRFWVRTGLLGRVFFFNQSGERCCFVLCFFLGGGGRSIGDVFHWLAGDSEFPPKTTAKMDNMDASIGQPLLIKALIG